MRLRQRRIQSEGPRGGGFRLGDGLLVRNHLVIGDRSVYVRQRGVRRGEAGVAVDGLLEELYAPSEIVERYPLLEILAFEVEIVGLQIRPVRRRGGPRGGGDIERSRNRPGDLIADREHVFGRPRVGVGPDVKPVLHVDELSANSDRPACRGNAAFEDGAHA